MLPRIRRLFDRYGGLAFNDERIEIFGQKRLDRLGERTDNPRVQFFQGIENGQGSVLKDRIRV